MTVPIDLHGRRVLVTGGGRGIGAEICRMLADSGAQVVVNYRADGASAARVVEHIERAHGLGRAFAVQGDVAEESSVARMFAELRERFDALDILVNNAGTESTVAAIDLPTEEWDRVLGVNLRGAFVCSRDAARWMRAQGGGVIINIASIHDTLPRLGLVHYCVSKAGLSMLTRSLGLELAEFGIRVVGVAPGVIETEMNAAEIEAIGRQSFEEWIPVRRLGSPRDVANLICFLASDLAAYVTGVTIPVDGAYAINAIRYDPRHQQA
jgi:glucose 1-dehydrogenase